MNLADAAILQAKITAYDNRPSSELTDAAWAEALDDVTLTDALDAVRQHYRTETRWIMPADVRRLATAARKARIAAAGRPDIPHGLDQVAERRYVRHWIQLVGAGANADQATEQADQAAGVERGVDRPYPVAELIRGFGDPA